MRFRFSLGSLFLTIAVVAIACACWPTIHQAVICRSLQARGATIQLEDDTKPWYDRPPKNFVDHIDAEITVIVWDSNLQKGNTALIDDAGFKNICRFPKVWNITLDDCDVTDTSIGNIRFLQSLSVLRFRKSQIGDAGVKQIVQKKTINNLVLANSKVTDLSGSEFKSLPALYYLDLSGTLVTDQSVPELMQNAGLTYLNVSGTGISTQGVAMLEAALPNCKVVR